MRGIQYCLITFAGTRFSKKLMVTRVPTVVDIVIRWAMDDGAGALAVFSA